MSATGITRETFFTFPIETLKKEMGSDKIRDIFLSTFDDAWIAQQTIETLVKFASRFVAVCSTEGSLSEWKFGLLMIQISKVQKLALDGVIDIYRQVLEEVYEFPPADFRALAICLNHNLSSTAAVDRSPYKNKEHLGILEVALTYHSTKIRDIYLQNPPLDDFSPHGHDLFSLSCVYGTVDDFIFALETYERIKGTEALRLYTECDKYGLDRNEDIRKLLKRNKNFPNAKEKIVHYYRSKGLELPLFLKNKDLGSKTTLTDSSTAENPIIHSSEKAHELILSSIDINKESFFAHSIESLKNAITSSKTRRHLLSTFDNDWIKSQTIDTLVTFMVRIFAICSWDSSSTTPSQLLSKIVRLQNLAKDEDCDSFARRILEEAFEKSRSHFIDVAIGLYRQLNCDSGSLANLTEEEEFFLIREVESQYRSAKIREAYPLSLPLDAKLPHHVMNE